MLAKVPCILDALLNHLQSHLSDRIVAKIRTGGRRPVFSPDNISPVCVRWRNLSSSTPALWTHIDLGIDQLQATNFAFQAQRSLERAGQLPLYVHAECDRKPSDTRTLVSLLAPYANRIISLDLYGNTLTSRSILLGLFSRPYRGSVRHLHLYDENDEEPYEPRSGLFLSDLLDEFLLSLSSLSLYGPSLDHNSPAFHGLTDLPVIFSGMYVTPNQLAQILAACPELCSLTFLALLLAPGKPPANAANLPRLQTLDLRCTAFNDVVTITSCISPKKGLSLSLSLNMLDDDSRMHHLSPLSSFFKQFHIARLFLNADHVSLDPALHSLKTPLPSLGELALDGDLLRDSLVNGFFLVLRFPRLHTLHIIGKIVSTESTRSNACMLAYSNHPIQMARASPIQGLTISFKSCSIRFLFCI